MHGKDGDQFPLRHLSESHEVVGLWGNTACLPSPPWWRRFFLGSKSHDSVSLLEQSRCHVGTTTCSSLDLVGSSWASETGPWPPGTLKSLDGIKKIAWDHIAPQADLSGAVREGFKDEVELRLASEGCAHRREALQTKAARWHYLWG